MQESLNMRARNKGQPTKINLTLHTWPKSTKVFCFFGLRGESIDGRIQCAFVINELPDNNNVKG